MFCPKCGFQNDDKTMYCRKCGNPLKQSAGRPNQSAMNADTGGAGGGLQEALRELILSPLYLVAVIALSAQVLFSIIAAATGYSGYSALVYRLLDATGVPYEYYPYQLTQVLEGLNSTSVVSAIFSNLPVIAIAAGLWILFLNARDSIKSVETTGLTVIRIVTIVQMVLYGIGLLAAVFAGIIMTVAIGKVADINPAGIVILLLLILGVTGFLVFFYYIKILKTVRSAESILMNGNMPDRASMFVIVLTFIAGGFQCLTCIGAIAGGVVSFLSSVAVATATIAFGLLMLRFNDLRLQAEDVPAGGRMQQSPGFANMQGMQGSVNMQPGTPAAGGRMQQSPGPANMQGMQGSVNMQPGTPAAGGRMQQSPGFANMQGMQGSVNMQPGTPAAGGRMQQSPGFANIQGMQGSVNMQPGMPAPGGRMQQSPGFANIPPTAPNANAQFMNAQFSAQDNLRMNPPVGARSASEPAFSEQDNTLPMFPPRRESAVTGNNGEEEKKRRYEQVGTTFLDEESQMPSAILVHVDDGKEIRITKTNFTIGKAYGSVDLFIDNNSAISRNHAEIIYKDDGYYIVDTNSTNHVFVDGKKIPAGKPVPISDGAVIRLGNEAFEFHQE